MANGKYKTPTGATMGIKAIKLTTITLEEATEIPCYLKIREATQELNFKDLHLLTGFK